MSTVITNPTRLPALTAGRIGHPRRFRPVTPFVRAHLALRRIAVEGSFAGERVGSGEVRGCMPELRRVVHVCHLG